MSPKPIHPFTPANADAWIGTAYVLIEQRNARPPTKEELVQLANASAAGADQDGLRAIMATWPAPEPPQSPSLPPLTRISANGFDLKDETGARFFAKGCTDFLLYQRFLNGEDIQPILAERSGLGANILRVFGMVDSFSHWHPQDYGDRYYTQLQAFCDLLASYRLYVYFTVFADTRLVMPNTADQVRHWDRVVEALKASPNTIVEVGNELDQHDNAVDANLQRPSGILACRGSYGGQPAANPPMITPDWDLGDFHARRDYPKAIVDMPVVQLQTGDTTDGVSHRVPIWHGEPQGFGPNPKRWQSPHKARELAGTARGTACGIFLHSDAGVKSELFDDVTKACAVAFFQELAGL